MLKKRLTDFVIEVLRKMTPFRYHALGKVFFKNIIDPIALFEIVDEHPHNEAVMDLVCRVRVKADAAPERIPYHARTYFFCSFDCARAFVLRPDQYVKG